MERSRQNGKKAPESSTTIAQLRNALVDEWINIPVRTVNALVNSIQRRIRAAAATRGGEGRKVGSHEILITAVNFHFQLWRYLPMNLKDW